MECGELDVTGDFQLERHAPSAGQQEQLPVRDWRRPL